MEQDELLRKLGKVLAKLRIPYLITGGIAVVAWGRPRFTADIDVVIELLPKNLEQLAKELEAIDNDVYVDRNMMSRALTTQGEFNFIHPSSGLKVDFWILTNEKFDRERMRRRIKRKIAGIPLFFSSPEDLILIKLRWHKESGSEQQLRDVESIIKIQKKLDWRYLAKWSKKQRTVRILKELKAQSKRTRSDR